VVETLKEKIYSTIMEQIMTGRISPDEFLTEARLAAQFQASRAPVREALVALCNERILSNRFQVRPPFAANTDPLAV
jgi:DNA-binding GntR family transcriptional regulator